MSSTRKRRRRYERQRAKQRRPERHLSVVARIGSVVAGIAFTLAGIGLVVGGGSNAERLGRLAGILILVGLALVAVGIIGRM